MPESVTLVLNVDCQLCKFPPAHCLIGSSGKPSCRRARKTIMAQNPKDLDDKALCAGETHITKRNTLLQLPG
jgi:hypothetical protein